MSVATLARIKKIDIDSSIGKRISQKITLCTDSHVSYKGFANDNDIEHHTLRANLKEYVKDNIYHVQHVNSMHNRLKKWINNRFWGVSTKYLQQYLNWFQIKEIFNYKKIPMSELAKKSIIDIQNYKRFSEIPKRYEILISSRN